MLCALEGMNPCRGRLRASFSSICSLNARLGALGIVLVESFRGLLRELDERVLEDYVRRCAGFGRSQVAEDELCAHNSKHRGFFQCLRTTHAGS